MSNVDPGVAITVLHQALDIQTTYGAVLLSFLGALHWGFEFAGYGGQKGCVGILVHRDARMSKLAHGLATAVYSWVRSLWSSDGRRSLSPR